MKFKSSKKISLKILSTNGYPFLSWPWCVNELVFVLYAAVAICMCLSAYTCVYVLVCVCEHIWVCTCMCWFLCICMRVRQMRSDQFTEVHKFHLFSSDWFCHGLFSSLYSCLLFLFSLWVFQCMPTSQKHITGSLYCLIFMFTCNRQSIDIISVYFSLDVVHFHLDYG